MRDTEDSLLYANLPASVTLHKMIPSCALRAERDIITLLIMLRRCDKVSFCIIDKNIVVPQKYTTYFRSVIIFGRVSIMDQYNEIRIAIEKLAVKYYPENSSKNRDLMIEREYEGMWMVKIEIKHMTGKEAIELVKGIPCKK